MPVAVAPVVPVAPSALPDPDAFFPAEPVPSVEEQSRPARPITSEMVALDAFDAFDTVWGSSEQRETTAAQPASTPPLDEESLGSGFAAPEAWAEDITAGDTMSSAPEPVEATVPTPSIGIPSWLADDHEPTPSDAEPTVAAAPEPTIIDDTIGETEPSSSDVAHAAWSPPRETPAEHTTTDWTVAPPPEAPDADVVSTAESLGDALAALAESHNAVAPEGRATRFELVDETRPSEALPAAASIDPGIAHGLRVSAALDRLAQRVRGGEIDVSSVAPEATDAAILASVLAALLGGSSSR